MAPKRSVVAVTERAAVADVAYVAGDPAVPADRQQAAGHGACLDLVAACDHHLAALGGQASRAGLPDARRPPADQHGLAGETLHVDLPRPVR